MNNLYFKKSLYDFFDCNLIYKRTMEYMVATDIYGNEFPRIYSQHEFISVDEYFNTAEKIYKYASRIKPVTIGNIDDAAFFNEYKKKKSFILLYASKELGIGYDLETETYEIIPKEYICDYKTGGWRFGKEVLPICPTKEDIIKFLLNNDVKENIDGDNKLLLVRNNNKIG